MSAAAAYFTGANTCFGFRSGYDAFTREKDVKFIYIIKGGPGCGKSSFMKALASAMLDCGIDAEYLYCSGDPSSLDGVFFPSLSTAYLDGTAPHVLEPYCAGITGSYVSFADFYDEEHLVSASADVLSITREYKDAYSHAYAALRAYGELFSADGITDPAASEKACERVRLITRRALGRGSNDSPILRERWLEAFTCEGSVFLCDTVKALCGRIILLDNEYGLAHPALRACEAEALSLGHDTVRCLHPLFPDRVSAVLVPGASCAFIAADRERARLFRGSQHIRLDSLAAKSSSDMRQCRRSSELGSRLLEAAHGELARAKELHDRLEGLYNPHVDFGGVYALADKHINMLRTRGKCFDKSASSV